MTQQDEGKLPAACKADVMWRGMMTIKYVTKMAVSGY